MENAGVIPPRHDRSIGHTTGPLIEEMLFDQRLNLSFAHAGLHNGAGQLVGGGRNPTGLAQTLQLRRLLAQAHAMQQGTGRQQGQGRAPGSRSTIELPGPGGNHQRLNGGMATDAEGDALSTVQIVGKPLLKLRARVGDIGTETLHGPLAPPATSGPNLSGWFARVHKQHKPFPLRPMGQQQSHRIWLIKTGQVPEIAVLTERPFRIGMMGDQGGSGNNRSCTPQILHESLTTIRMTSNINEGGAFSHERDRLPSNSQDGRQSAPP